MGLLENSSSSIVISFKSTVCESVKLLKLICTVKTLEFYLFGGETSANGYEIKGSLN